MVHNVGLLIEYLELYLKYHSKQTCFYLDLPEGTIWGQSESFIDTLDEFIDDIRINFESVDSWKKIQLKFIFSYYDEIVKGFSNREHLAPLIKRLDKRISDISMVIEIVDTMEGQFDKNFTIVSLKEVNIHMRKILPLLFSKQLYEEKKLKNEKSKYLNIIIDEAHNILSSNSQRESELWKDYRLETFEEIIKEGRKFGVFLTIASQRPYDISSTIISQLHNYFLHRLINNNDINAIEKTVSYLDKVSFESIPILPTGTCIVAGLAAQNSNNCRGWKDI